MVIEATGNLPTTTPRLKTPLAQPAANVNPPASRPREAGLIPVPNNGSLAPPHIFAGERAADDAARATVAANRNAPLSSPASDAAAVRAYWSGLVDFRGRAPAVSHQRPALWRSKSHPGFLAGHIPGVGRFFAHDLHEAALAFARHGIAPLQEQQEQQERQAFAQAVQQHWNGQVTVLDTMPPPEYPYAAVWPTRAQRVGLQIPGFQPVMVASMQEAQQLLSAHGIHPGQTAQPATDGGLHEMRSHLTSPAQLAQLEEAYGIQITPITVGGVTGAYLFSAKGTANRNVMLASHGVDAGLGYFEKPRQLELINASPHGTLLMGYSTEYAARLKANQVAAHRDMITPPSERYAINYLLSGTTEENDGPMLPWQAAHLVSDINQNPDKRKFDIVVVEPAAGNITLSDLIAGLGQRLGPEVHKKMFSHICRGPDEHAPRYSSGNNFGHGDPFKRVAAYFHRHHNR
ncbi:MAG: hypothetical protein EOO28_01860 [Comamonadaceae bacterium]|nr:MAG: hypothetical protein EOO28_01860 [Comamonadaceae bacterium]